MKKVRNILLILLTLSSKIYCQSLIDSAKDYLSIKKIDNLVLVSIKDQKLFLIKNDLIYKTYLISSSKYGIGNESGSHKTPIGLHQVNKKIGENTPIFGRMIGRKYYGNIAEIYHDTTQSKTDDITSRILWLKGMEKGINKGDGIDSYERYIYIHGTSEEGRIGHPNSNGCIRMLNKDIINLYNNVEVGTLVLIL